MSELVFQLPEEGHWIWDDSISGISFVSAVVNESPSESQFHLTRKLNCHVPGTLFSDLRLSFSEIPKTYELARFRRHVQRPSQEHDDVVTLRDIKDIAIFQLKQEVSQFFLDLFYTPEVDQFLRRLILYFHHYLQTWDWMHSRAIEHANKIRLPGLRKSEIRERENLAILRLLVAQSYQDILLGVGKTKRFYHMANPAFSWNQRDVRIWEYLLRLSGRVVWLALHRRFHHLIENEMDRMFRSSNFISEERPDDPLTEAVLKSIAGSRKARLAPKAIGAECPRDQEQRRTPRFMTMSPLAHELLNGKHDWRLLGLGRIPLDSERDQDFIGLLQLMDKTEEKLAAEGKIIGILGMSRLEMDAMLTASSAKRVPESRSLADDLEKVIGASTQKSRTEKPEPKLKKMSKCELGFPRGSFAADEEKQAQLADGRRIWRKNYDKLK